LSSPASGAWRCFATVVSSSLIIVLSRLICLRMRSFAALRISGDAADMAIIELVGIGGAETVRRRRKQKKGSAGPVVDSKAPELDNKSSAAAEGQQ